MYNRSYSMVHDSCLALCHGYKLEFTVRPPSRCARRVTRIPAHPDKRKALLDGVTDLLAKGAVTELTAGLITDGFISTLFLTEKSTGGWRPILNLRSLNQFIRPQHFRMDTLPLLLRVTGYRLWDESFWILISLPALQEDKFFSAG